MSNVVKFPEKNNIFDLCEKLRSHVKRDPSATLANLAGEPSGIVLNTCWKNTDEYRKHDVYDLDFVERETDRTRYLERAAFVADLEELYDGIVWGALTQGWTLAECLTNIRALKDEIKERM